MLEKAVSSPEIPGPIPLKLIEEARERIKGTVLRTPLVRLNVDDAPADIFLKLENLQPTGSFKVRGASNAIALAGPDAKKRENTPAALETWLRNSPGKLAKAG